MCHNAETNCKLHNYLVFLSYLARHKSFIQVHTLLYEFLGFEEFPEVEHLPSGKSDKAKHRKRSEVKDTLAGGFCEEEENSKSIYAGRTFQYCKCNIK